MDFLKAIDVFTVPARFLEPKGLYLLEAMACGLPAVVPTRGAFPEMIGASGGGLLCEPENSVDLAVKLGVLLDDPDAARVLGEQGRAWVSEENDRCRMATVTASVYETALASARAEDQEG